MPTKRLIRLCILAGISLAIYLIWIMPTPRHDRDRRHDTRVLPAVSRASDRPDETIVTIHNVRDAHHDPSIDDPTAARSYTFDDRTYNIDELTALWLYVEPFGAFTGAAHTMFAFEWEDGRTVVASVEARIEQTESYAIQRGLIRSYELIYVWGDERDMIWRRAGTQDHDLYLYKLDVSNTFIQSLFRTLIDETQSISRHPRRYNTALHNCTSELFRQVRRSHNQPIPRTRARLLPGRSDLYLLSHGWIDIPGSLPTQITSAPGFDPSRITIGTLREHTNVKHLVNADDAGQDADLPHLIRDRLTPSDETQ